jgi:single-stranded DNA-binding protein 3
MNKVTLMGRLTKNPETRYTPNNTVYTTFTLAVNRIYGKDIQEADFINIIAWNKTAEIVSTYLTKGNLIALAGRIQTRDYDGKDGKKVYVTEVVAEEIFFTGSTNNGYTSKTKIEEEFEIEEEPEIDFEELNNEIETMEW